jgi:hypothetical protein
MWVLITASTEVATGACAAATHPRLRASTGDGRDSDETDRLEQELGLAGEQIGGSPAESEQATGGQGVGGNDPRRVVLLSPHVYVERHKAWTTASPSPAAGPDRSRRRVRRSPRGRQAILVERVLHLATRTGAELSP